MNTYIFHFPKQNCQITVAGYWRASEMEFALSKNMSIEDYQITTIGYSRYGRKGQIINPATINETEEN